MTNSLINSLAVFASAVTYLLLQYASLRLPSAKVMAYTYLTPSWVILWEISLGNGAPPALVFGGVALTGFALYLLLREEDQGASSPSSTARNRSKASRLTGSN